MHTELKIIDTFKYLGNVTSSSKASQTLKMTTQQGVKSPWLQSSSCTMLSSTHCSGMTVIHEWHLIQLERFHKCVLHLIHNICQQEKVTNSETLLKDELYQGEDGSNASEVTSPLFRLYTHNEGL